MNKKFFTMQHLVLLITSLLISSYTFAELPHTPEQTEEINGIVYDLQSDEPFTGEVIYYSHDNKPLYLIYGYEFNYRVMEYKNGKLDGMSYYVDQGDNPVLFEWYEDGAVTEQMSGAHEASARGINYGPKCGSAGSDGWRRCPKMGKE